MEQLNGLDASFLAVESANQTGHVASLMLFELDAASSELMIDAVRRKLAARVPGLAPLRRRLVEVPFGLDRPFWIDDPDFDLDYHLRHIAVPPPGSDEQLAELVARIHARPLDRARPLWEAYVIEGHESGQVALYMKVHHCAVDGVAGVELARVLFSDEPGEVASAKRMTRSEPVPSSLEMLLRGVLGLARRPRRIVRGALRAAQAAGRSRDVGALATASGLLPLAHSAGLGRVPGLYRRLGLSSAEDEGTALPESPAPKTPFNRSITPHRRFAWADLSLAEVKRVRKAFDVTLNDVVLAISSHALRSWLERHEALPLDPLIAMVPVSVRAETERGAGGNRVASVLADLASDEPDPVQRLLRIHRAMNAAKRMHATLPAQVAMEFTQFAAGVLAVQGPRVLARAGLTERVNPIFNVAISNVPGPRQPLSLSGARLAAYYPVSMLVDGQGLNITVVSYGDTLHFGLLSCRELIPDLWDLAREFSAGLEALAKAAAARAGSSA
jgi:WS/DGAT/MGAT family acyltransferase